MKRYSKFASLMDKENIYRSSETIESKIADEMDTAPHGSGIDSDVVLDISKSNRNKLIFLVSYHHINETGFYDGWTDHKIIVTPDLVFGYTVKITGRDRNFIKDYLADIFNEWLREDVQF